MENERLKQQLADVYCIDDLKDMEPLFSDQRFCWEAVGPDPIAALLPVAKEDLINAPMLELRNLGKDILGEVNLQGRQMTEGVVTKFRQIVERPVPEAANIPKEANAGTYHGENSVEQEQGKTFSASNSKALKILSYNVWVADLEKHIRMKALGDLIQLHFPEVLCFQEVTSEIYDTFQQSSWWKMYSCSIPNVMKQTREHFCMKLSKLEPLSCKPFSYSIMGRELRVADIEVQKDMTLAVATSHLEIPAPPKRDHMYSKERVEQAKESVKFLDAKSNVVFFGDMSWDNQLDGQFPLPDGWFDAWASNRFVCKLQNFQISATNMIGKDAILNPTCIKEKKVKGEVGNLESPVLPSDHCGLLLEILPK